MESQNFELDRTDGDLKITIYNNGDFVGIIRVSNYITLLTQVHVVGNDGMTIKTELQNVKIK